MNRLFPKKQKQKQILLVGMVLVTNIKPWYKLAWTVRHKLFCHEQKISSGVVSGHRLITNWVMASRTQALSISVLVSLPLASAKGWVFSWLQWLLVEFGPMGLLTSHRRERENLFPDHWCTGVGLYWLVRSNCQIFRNFANWMLNIAVIKNLII